MGEITARQIMVQLEHYPHARQSQTLAEAAEMLTRSPIEAAGTVSMPRVLLVFGDDDQLLGVVRRRDILRGIEPQFHEGLDAAHPEAHVPVEVDPNLADLVPALEPDRLAQRLGRPIGEVVHALRAQVDVDDSLLKIVRELVGNDTHIAAVVEAGSVIGVVRTLDVLRAIADLQAD